MEKEPPLPLPLSEGPLKGPSAKLNTSREDRDDSS